MPAYPHRIRLRGPWEWDTLTGPAVRGDAARRGRVTMPCSLAQAGLSSQTGPVRFSRRFGMPGSLDRNEHVWLCFEPQARQTDVILNEQRLAELVGSGRFAVECTNVLRQRNQLDVLLQANSDQDGLTGETYLEIRRSAYLQNARVRRLPDGRMAITVELSGKSEHELDLYLLSGRQTLAYRKTSVAGGHQTAELISDSPVAVEASDLRLELVQGGVVWYQLECDASLESQ
jgi:hypothetical protein